MRILVTASAFGILALALAVLLAGDIAWPLDLLTFFWPVLSLAAVAVLPFAFVFAHRAARFAALAAVAACAFPFLALPPQPGDEAGERLRILAANLYVGNPDPRPFVALLTHAQPDIVVTEETRGHFVEAIRGSGLYPFENDGDLYATDDKKVFSRYPIREARQLDDLPGAVLERHPMRLVIDTPAGPLVLYAIHPDSPRSIDQWRQRNAYFDLLARAVRAEPEGSTVVLAGDWNLPAHSSFFRAFFDETGLGLARPGLWLPVTRFATRLARYGYFGSTIDHVALSPNIRVTRWQRGPDIGSNHLPVIVDLALPSASALASQ
jgi:endonuclease/exonuclease/phosphatase (EEP) superfamily protein YafD